MDWPLRRQRAGRATAKLFAEEGAQVAVLIESNKTRCCTDEQKKKYQATQGERK